MSITIIFKSAAIDDIKQIKYWYRLQKKGLEKDFVKELKLYVNLLKNNKKLFQARYKEIRAIPLKRFPYLVYYILQKDTVFVIAVIAASQDQMTLLQKR